MVGAPAPLAGWPPAFRPPAGAGGADAADAGGAGLGTPPNVVGADAPWGLVPGEPSGLTAQLGVAGAALAPGPGPLPPGPYVPPDCVTGVKPETGDAKPPCLLPSGSVASCHCPRT